MGGCAGTSNTLAGFRYGIPVMGTSAHSWVMSFACEKESFRKLQRVLGEATVQLLDTYEPLTGARVAAKDFDGDGRADVAVGSGAGSPSRVRLYAGKDFAGGGEPGTHQDLDPLAGAVLADGVYVG